MIKAALGRVGSRELLELGACTLELYTKLR